MIKEQELQEKEDMDWFSRPLPFATQWVVGPRSLSMTESQILSMMTLQWAVGHVHQKKEDDKSKEEEPTVPANRSSINEGSESMGSETNQSDEKSKQKRAKWKWDFKMTSLWEKDELCILGWQMQIGAKPA